MAVSVLQWGRRSQRRSRGNKNRKPGKLEVLSERAQERRDGGVLTVGIQYA